MTKGMVIVAKTGKLLMAETTGNRTVYGKLGIIEQVSA